MRQSQSSRDVARLNARVEEHEAALITSAESSPPPLSKIYFFAAPPAACWDICWGRHLRDPEKTFVFSALGGWLQSSPGSQPRLLYPPTRQINSRPAQASCACQRQGASPASPLCRLSSLSCLQRPAIDHRLQPPDVRKFGAFSFSARNGSAAGRTSLKANTIHHTASGF
jgi:hypothetical protein